MVPTTIDEMDANAIAFIRALGLDKADVLGFSIGGTVAQEITLRTTELVSKLILVGTDPRGGAGIESLTLESQASFDGGMIHPRTFGSAFSYVIGEEPGRKESFS